MQNRLRSYDGQSRAQNNLTVQLLTYTGNTVLAYPTLSFRQWSHVPSGSVRGTYVRGCLDDFVHVRILQVGNVQIFCRLVTLLEERLQRRPRIFAALNPTFSCLAALIRGPNGRNFNEKMFGPSPHFNCIYAVFVSPLSWYNVIFFVFIRL